ncbi:MAG: hypothetical protein HDT43_13255 [Ruminococcaceae bacterium]|nr:hypothetical protein [Oscillospiraceae bacterium]
MSENPEIIKKVKELSAVKVQIAKLNERKKELEAFFLERGNKDVADTKYKSHTYADEKSQAAVTYTEAQSLEITAPNYLKQALGENVYNDVFEENVTTEVKPKNKDIERMIIGIFTEGFIKSLPKDVIAQIPCDEKAKAALAKKLKGAKFETDRDNLMKLGGLSEADAGDYAYMFAEAVVWQTLCRVAEMSGADKDAIIHSINLGVSVDSSTKISVT